MNPLHFAAPLDRSIFLLNSCLKLVGTPGAYKVVLNAFLYCVMNSQAAPSCRSTPLHWIFLYNRGNYRGKIDALNLQGIPPKLVLEFIIFYQYNWNGQSPPTKLNGAAKWSALRTLFALSKIHYIEFGRYPTQNFSKIKQFLLLEVK